MLIDENENFDGNELETVGAQISKLEEEATSLPEKYRNKSLEEVIRMHQEAEKLIGKQAQEVGEVRKLADELIKSNLASKNQPAVQEEPEVDFFEDPRKAVQKTVEAHPDVLAARQAAQEFKKMQVQQKLQQAHPDFAQIVQDAGFTEWVKSSSVRMSLYSKADAEYDFDSANELLSTYKELRGIRAKQMSHWHAQQMLILFHIKSHFSNNTHPQTQAHIGLDHISIKRGHHDIRADALSRKGFINLASAGEPFVIGNHRIFGNIF